MPCPPSGSYDVVVIGAGAVGASVAYELSRRGASVVVLEREEDVGGGCSYANAGLLSPSHVAPLTTPANISAGLRSMFHSNSPFSVSAHPRLVPWLGRFIVSARPRRARMLTERMSELAARSLQLHENYSRDGLETGFRRAGIMDVYFSERELRSAVEDRGETSASAYKPLSSAEAREIEPALGKVAGAILHPDEAQCESRSFVHATLAAAEACGARTMCGIRVRQLATHNGRVVGAVTDTGTVPGNTVVVAAGLASSTLCSSIGVPLSMEACKGYVLDYSAQSPPSIPLAFRELRVVVTPYPHRLHLSGSLDLSTSETSGNSKRAAAVQARGHQALPGLQQSNHLQTWVGSRPSTADGVPVLGRSNTYRNLVVTAGHGMWGLVLAPVTGELVAQGLLEGAPTLHEPSFSPDRFKGPAMAFPA